MKLPALRPLIPVLLALAPVGVFAQATPSPITAPLEVEYAGESLNGKPRLFITAQQCEPSGSKLRFRAKYTSSVRVLEGWIGKGSTDCSSPEARTRTSLTSLPICRRAYLTEESTTQLSFEVQPSDLFWTSDPGAPSWPEDDTETEDAGSTRPGPGCDQVTNQIYTLHILALNHATDLRGNIAYSVPSTTPVLKAAFTLYTKRLSAPTGLAGRDGEEELTLAFETVPGAPVQTKYRAYFDWGMGADACGSGALQAGQSAPAESETVTSVETQAGEAKLTKLDAKGIALGDTVAVSVVAIDPAGSESFLAEPVCVTRRMGEGEGEPPRKGHDGLLCSVQSGARERSAWSLGLLLGGLALGFALRRAGYGWKRREPEASAGGH